MTKSNVETTAKTDVEASNSSKNVNSNGREKMSDTMKKIAKKAISKKESKTESNKKTKVVNSLDVLIKKLVATITVKEAINLTVDAKAKDKKDHQKTFVTKYFSVIAFDSQLSERDVTERSREYLIQNMLLNNKSVKQIYNEFVKSFNESKFDKKNSRNETFQQFIERRFNKYIKQEANKIKTCFVINCKKESK